MRSHPLSRSIRRIFATSTATLALLGATAALAPADAVAAGRTQPDLFVDLLMTDHFNPAEGETFHAQIDVRNGGTGDSDPLSITVSVPAGLRTTALTTTDGWNCAVAGEASYTCAYPALPAAGRAQRLSLPFVVAGAQPGSRVPITAAIAPQRQESDTTNNTSTVTVAISGTCVVRGVVWHDLDRDGQRDEGEPGIGAGPDGVLSVRVGARQGQTTGGGTAVVNPDGTWSLTTRTELLYLVWVEAAGTYGRTASDVGDDATDSDMVTTYRSDPYLLTSSAEFFAVHGGEYVVDTGLVPRS